MFCPSCGQPANDNNKFCEECGQPLAPAWQSAAPTQQILPADEQEDGALTQQIPPADGQQFVAPTQQMPYTSAQQQFNVQGYQQYGTPLQQGQGGMPPRGGAKGMGAHGRPPQGGKKKTGLIVGIVVAVIVVVGAAGAAAWWFMGQQGGSSSSAAAADSSASATSEASQSESSASADSSNAASSASSSASDSAASASASASAASASASSAAASDSAPSASAGAQSPTNRAFEGKWKLVRMEQANGSVTSEEELAELEAQGKVFVIALEADGRAVLTAGENDTAPLEGTWVATSDADGTVYFTEYEDEMHIANGQLLIVEDGAKMFFAKIL